MKNTRLKFYIHKVKRVTIKSAAKQVGCSRQNLTEIANGKECGKALAKRIEAWSDGWITAAELIGV